MTEDSKKQDQLLETTDCLEAIGTLKSFKNLFFFICLLCLLLLQGSFWFMFTDHVNTEPNKPAAVSSRPAENVTVSAPIVQPKLTGAEAVSANSIAPISANSVEPNKPKSDPNVVWHKYTDQLSHAKIKFSQLAWIIRICNYVLIVCSVVYSMSLLFGLMISLIGRLGGISHVTKAFFISLFVIVLLMPWQLLFKNVGIGAIFKPAELLAAWQIYTDANFFARTFIYLRYVGLPVVVILLLVWAQLKSMRWSKNTLKRLGIVG
ncbi:MAG: hypothetical protein WC496_06275 [Phycisphaerae bacterium]|jgi:hypothetical protein